MSSGNGVKVYMVINNSLPMGKGKMVGQGENCIIKPKENVFNSY